MKAEQDCIRVERTLDALEQAFSRANPGDASLGFELNQRAAEPSHFPKLCLTAVAQHGLFGRLQLPAPLPIRRLQLWAELLPLSQARCKTSRPILLDRLEGLAREAGASRLGIQPAPGLDERRIDAVQQRLHAHARRVAGRYRSAVVAGQFQSQPEI